MMSFSDQYEMMKFKSQGEIYELRECKDINSGDIKAVKIYRKVELTPTNIEMIKREMALLKRLDHPNLMKIHNIIEDEDRIYQITDNIKGHNLFKHIIVE